MRYAVIIKKALNNSAYAPDIPGCVATSETLENAIGSLGKV